MPVDGDPHGFDGSGLGPEVVAQGSLSLTGGSTKDVDTGVKGPVFVAVGVNDASLNYDGVIKWEAFETDFSDTVGIRFTETSGSVTLNEANLTYTIYQF